MTLVADIVRRRADLPSSERWQWFGRPFHDELLSSWLRRIVQKNSLYSGPFCDRFWPERDVWVRDLDMHAPPEVLETLRIQTNTNHADVYQTTLKSYEGLVFEKAVPLGRTRFVLPINAVGRNRIECGLQWCPRCLSEDKEPYWRKRWRLACSVACTVHKLELLDRCPDCQSPFAPHLRRDLLCQRCGLDQSKVPSDSITSRITDIQNKIDSVLDGKTFFESNFSPALKHPLLTFRLIWIFMRFFIANDRADRICKVLEERLYAEKFSDTITRNWIRIEDSPIKARLFALERVAYILENWPDNFLSICKESHFSLTWITRDLTLKNCPYTLLSLSQNFLRGNPSKKLN